MIKPARPVGDLLRDWRRRRRLSQLELACKADISTRHLSFLETGRSAPSREMVLHLAEQLDVPLRERNQWLRAAGYADVYPERPLADPALVTARVAVDLVLKGHEPYPALAVDRYWTLVARNDGVARLLEGVAPALLRPPVNVLRLSLHPAGLAPRIANFPEWRAHLLNRLQRQIDATLDAELAALMDELRAYPSPAGSEAVGPRAGRDHGGVVVPLELITRSGVLALFSTTTIFGTPVDITLSELALELFYPADAATTEFLLAGPARRHEGGPDE
jgi:transcriptional regulator with XRE-family HTH domain